MKTLQKRFEILGKKEDKKKRLKLSEGVFLISEPVICQTPDKFGSEPYVHHMRFTLQLCFGNAVRYRRLISSTIERDEDYLELIIEVKEELRSLFYEVFEYKTEMLDQEYCAHEVEEVL